MRLPLESGLPEAPEALLNMLPFWDEVEAPFSWHRPSTQQHEGSGSQSHSCSRAIPFRGRRPGGTTWCVVTGWLHPSWCDKKVVIKGTRRDELKHGTRPLIGHGLPDPVVCGLKVQAKLTGVGYFSMPTQLADGWCGG